MKYQYVHLRSLIHYALSYIFIMKLGEYFSFAETNQKYMLLSLN